jgi:hypothetical protein
VILTPWLSKPKADTTNMKKSFLTLTAFASLTIASQASIFDNKEEARTFIANFHQNLGQNVTVNNSSVFVEQRIGGHFYDLAKAFITDRQSGVQVLKCYVQDPEAHWMNCVTENTYQYFLATGDRSGWNLPNQLDPLPATRPNNAHATVAMNRLQDALGKPRVTDGVWYDAYNDTYHWIGPKFGRLMSEPASQFLAEVGPYLY